LDDSIFWQYTQYPSDTNLLLVVLYSKLCKVPERNNKILNNPFSPTKEWCPMADISNKDITQNGETATPRVEITKSRPETSQF
jgi:hypothetical protein